MPYSVTVNPVAGTFFKASSAEVYVDGTLAGSGGSSLLIPAGKCNIEIKAAGYKTKSFDFVVDKDIVLNIQLEK